jgi:hypothetical protein
MNDGYQWKDRDRCHGRVIGHSEVRLEQPDCPDDVAALLEVGEPPKPLPPRTFEGVTVTDSVISANPVYLTAEQAVEVALQLLDAAAAWRAEQSPGWPPVGPVADDDHDRRWKLHVHACSIVDSTFWVERHDGGYKATEVETGVTGAIADSTEAAMENYFAGRLLAGRHPRVRRPEGHRMNDIDRDRFSGTTNDATSAASGAWRSREDLVAEVERLREALTNLADGAEEYKNEARAEVERLREALTHADAMADSILAIKMRDDRASWDAAEIARSKYLAGGVRRDTA